MARVFSILLLLGSLACFGLATEDRIWVQTGAVNEGTGQIISHEPYTYKLTKLDKTEYAVLGVVLLGGSVYGFILSARRRQNEQTSA